jgi:four helix bundle protein
MNKTIKEKANQFSVKAAQLYRHLSANKKETVLSELYLRAATSVGASLSRADFAANRNEYLTKFYTALQGCGESRYWLDVMSGSETITEFEYNNNLESCEEMQNILSAAIKSIREQQSKTAP